MARLVEDISLSWIYLYICKILFLLIQIKRLEGGVHTKIIEFLRVNDKAPLVKKQQRFKHFLKAHPGNIYGKKTIGHKKLLVHNFFLYRTL